MNPYDEENFVQTKAQKQMLFIPKQVEKITNIATSQENAFSQKKKTPIQFTQISQPKTQIPIKDSAFNVEEEQQIARLTGNCPQQLPFANTDQLPLASLSTQFKKDYTPDRQVPGQHEISLKENMLLQFPSFLPYSKAPFVSMASGQTGVLRKHRSGKMTIKLNNGTILRVFPGQTVEMTQQVVLLDKTEHVVQKVCDVQGKLICSVEF